MPLQVAGQLRKMLQFWGERKVYDRDTLQQLEAAVQSRDRDAQLQPPKVCSLSSSGQLLLSGLPWMLQSARGTLQHLETTVQSASHDVQMQLTIAAGMLNECVSVLLGLPYTATHIPGFCLLTLCYVPAGAPVPWPSHTATKC